MFDANQNRALARTTQTGRFGGLLAAPNLETESGAFDAARNGWLGAAWLSLGFVLGLVIETSEAASRGGNLWLPAAIDGGGVAIMAGLAWLIWAKQPRWAVVLTFILLALSLVLSLLSLRIGLGLIINAVLLWTMFNAIRGAFRLAAFRSGRYSPKNVGEVFD